MCVAVVLPLLLLLHITKTHMAALLMQGVVSRGERRKAMKKKRIKRMIERKGGLERKEKKGGGVCAAFKD